MPWAAVQRSYLDESTPPVVVIDNLLTPPAIDALRTLVTEATVFTDGRPWGGVGARIGKGLCSHALLRVARELSDALPNVLCGRALKSAWAFKYDQASGSRPGGGIGLHADAAAVNLNLWIAEDDASGATSGGLRIWPGRAPDSWPFESFQDVDAIRSFLGASKPQLVAHRPNRLVLFDSSLFHQTDPGTFRPGYLNRRVSLTMLFGRRGESCLHDS